MNKLYLGKWTIFFQICVRLISRNLSYSQDLVHPFSWTPSVTSTSRSFYELSEKSVPLPTHETPWYTQAELHDQLKLSQPQEPTANFPSEFSIIFDLFWSHSVLSRWMLLFRSLDIHLFAPKNILWAVILLPSWKKIFGIIRGSGAEMFSAKHKLTGTVAQM